MKILINLTAGLLVMAIESAVLVQLWTWHVSPMGVPALAFWDAAGLMCLRFLLPSPLPSSLVFRESVLIPDDERRSLTIALRCMVPLFALLLGWLIHLAGA